MLIVNYKRKMGEVKLIQDGEEFTIDICGANCICAFIYTYVNDKGETMHQLHNFFADDTHINNLIRDNLEIFSGTVSHVQLNTFFTEYKSILRYFTHMGVEVTCYREIPKPEQK